jgi:hypothetical protein
MFTHSTSLRLTEKHVCCDIQTFARTHQTKLCGVCPAAPTLGITLLSLVCRPPGILFKIFWVLSRPLQTSYISTDLTYTYRAKQLDL